MPVLVIAVKLVVEFSPMFPASSPVPAFISQALTNKPLTVFGEGRQTRSFCYVSDLIEGIYRLMMSDYDLPVNIGNPREMTMLEFAEQVVRLTRSRSRLVFKPLPQDDPKQRQPDISKARQLLKWEPKVGFKALARMMTESDWKLARREKLLRDSGQ